MDNWERRIVLSMAILGFLHEEPLHGYELKGRIKSLTGHVRPVSDGALYPAITRLEKAGLLERRTEHGAAAAPRQVLSLTAAGRAELMRRLREPTEVEITDRNRYFTLLAFLRHLPSKAEQAEVLRRRLAFLKAPASFFSTGRWSVPRTSTTHSGRGCSPSPRRRARPSGSGWQRRSPTSAPDPAG
jgi:DNA-binding PadR family transcriptional regulator